MAKILVQQNDFRFGELDKFVFSKKDQNGMPYAKSGFKELENFFINKYALPSRRYGTKLMNEVKHPDKITRLIPFSIGIKESYVIELGDQYIRIHSENGLEKDDQQNIIELTTPYIEADLNSINNWAKGGNFFYIVNQKYPPYELIREKKTGYNNWIFRPIEFKLLKDENDDPTYSGTPTGISPWAANNRLELVITASDQLTSNDQNNYNFENNTIYRLEYEHEQKFYHTVYVRTTQAGSIVTFERLGGAEIVAAGNGENGIPKQTPFPLWQIQWGGDSTPYPNAVAVANQRLCFLQGGMFFASRVGDYTDFGIYTDSISATSPVQLKGFKTADNAYNWLMSFDDVLYAGTSAEVFRMVKSQADANLSINYSHDGILQEAGSIDLPPIQIGSMFLFVERNGIKFRVASYDSDAKRVSGVSLTDSNQGILVEGVVRTAYQTNPNNLIFLVKENGEVAICGFSTSEQGMYFGGWSNFKMKDGLIEDVCVVPNSTTGRDDVHFIVKRTINGTTKRYREVYNDLTTLYQEHNATNFVDALITVSTPFTIEERDGRKHIGGFNQLAGQEVHVIFNNNDIRQLRTITNDGFIKLEQAEELRLTEYSSVSVGLPYYHKASIPPVELFFEGRYSSHGEAVRAVDIKVMYQNSKLCDLYDRLGNLAVQAKTFSNNNIRQVEDAFVFEYRTNIFGTKTQRNTFFSLEDRQGLPLPCNIMAIEYFAEI